MAEIIKPAKYVNPTNFRDFLSRQHSIFRKDFVRSDQVEHEGITCTLPDVEHCYYVALIHPDTVNLEMAKFSIDIASKVSAVSYVPSNIHTTLANGYITRGEFTTNFDIINKLSETVQGIKDKISPLVYHAWLINRGGVIAAAYGNEGFFNIAQSIHQGAKSRDLELNFPCGAHMSASRFSEPRNPEQTKDLISFINQAKPIGQSMPSKITFGTAFTTKTEFRLDECGSIEF